MAAKRDVAKVIPAQSRLHSGVMRKDRTVGAVRAPSGERTDKTARSEAPTIPPPTELEVTQDPEQAGYTSGTFVAAREVMGADLRRDPRSEK